MYRPEAGSKIIAGLTDIFSLPADEVLSNSIHAWIQRYTVVKISQTLDHTSGIALDQHFCDFTVFVFAHQLHTGHHRGHPLDAAVQRIQQPPFSGGQGVGLTLNAVVLTKLILQDLLELGTAGFFLDTADAGLPHLDGFNNRGQYFFIRFHTITLYSMSCRRCFMHDFYGECIVCLEKGWCLCAL